ncbi:MAG TPA: 30S ribosomal protein S9 [Fimbriiglobus sp.]|jgi:small subunit ribosomal protein S9
MAEKKTYYLGTGRRKTAVARVRVSDGKGTIAINGRELDSYFTEDKDRAAVRGPLAVTDLGTRVDVTVKVAGGGITGQADAIKQGIARALKVMFAAPTERRAVTVGVTTSVRARNVQHKTTETAVGTGNQEAAPAADEAATGMVKKLRDGGFLTRDSRMKERKKYGLRGARRGTQFSKR